MIFPNHQGYEILVVTSELLTLRMALFSFFKSIILASFTDVLSSHA